MRKRSEKTLLRVNEAADIFGCTRQNLYRLIKENKLKTYKRYGLMLVDIDDVKRLKDEIIQRGTPRKKTEKKLEKSSKAIKNRWSLKDMFLIQK